MNARAVHDFLTGLQERIVAALEAEDGKRFRVDAWKRALTALMRADCAARAVFDVVQADLSRMALSVPFSR